MKKVFICFSGIFILFLVSCVILPISLDSTDNYLDYEKIPEFCNFSIIKKGNISTDFKVSIVNGKKNPAYNILISPDEGYFYNEKFSISFLSEENFCHLKTRVTCFEDNRGRFFIFKNFRYNENRYEFHDSIKTLYPYISYQFCNVKTKFDNFEIFFFSDNEFGCYMLKGNVVVANIYGDEYKIFSKENIKEIEELICIFRAFTMYTEQNNGRSSI